MNSLDQLLAAARSRLTRLSPSAELDAIRQGAQLVDIRPKFQRRRDGEIPGAIVIERNHLEWRLRPGSEACIPEAGQRRRLDRRDARSKTRAAFLLRPRPS